MDHPASFLPTCEQLEAWLATLSQDQDLVDTALGGECDAFALAMYQAIDKRWPGTRALPVIVERFRVGQESGEVIEHNPFSHVVLEVTTQDGQVVYVDASGTGADERWEEDWIQPGEFDEDEPCEDTFQYTTTTFEDIQARRAVDRKGTGIDEVWVKRFGQCLEQAAPFRESASTSPQSGRWRP